MVTSVPITRLLQGLAVALTSVLAIQPAAADSSLTTQAVASIISQTTTIDREADNSPPSGDVSAAGSGTNSVGQTFNGTATAFVDASNYGKLRMKGTTSMTGHGQAGATSRILINDTWDIAKALFNGQIGVATAEFLLNGSAATSFSGLLMDLAIRDDGALAFREQYQLTAAGSEFCQVNGVTETATKCFGILIVNMPFVWGTDFDVSLDWQSTAATSTNSDRGGFANYDFANSLYWGGITSVTANGVVVTDYAFSSDSGFDWRVSSIPSAVPEPATLALLGVGLAGLGFSRRKH